MFQKPVQLSPLLLFCSLSSAVFVVPEAIAAGGLLSVGQLQGHVEELQDHGSAALVPGVPIAAGTRIRTGADGRVELGVNGAPTFFSGSDSEFLVHSFEGFVVRARLSQGSLHIDARAASGSNSRDVRLNVGELRVRIAGAEAWALQTPAVTQVCMVSSGYIEVKRGEQLSRIDMPGQCLRLANTVAAWVVMAPEALAERLDLTAVKAPMASDTDANVAIAEGAAKPPTPAQVPATAQAQTPAPAQAAAPTQGPAQVEPAPAEVAEAPASPSPNASLPQTPPAAPRSADAPAAEGSLARLPATKPVVPQAAKKAKPEAFPPASVQGAGASGRAWSVVLASLSTRSAADAEAARLKGLGVRAEVRAYTVGERNGFRVGAGRYSSRSQADAGLAQFRKRYPKLSVWLAQY